jgi:hypothetical protein
MTGRLSLPISASTSSKRKVSTAVPDTSEMRRVTPIKNICGLTKLLYKKGNGPREFVVHVIKAHDYRLLSDQ